MSLFKNTFNVILEQDNEEIVPPEDAQVEGESPISDEIDPETSPEDFGAAVKPEEDIAAIKQQSLQAQKQELQSWIQKIEEFVEFINGVNDNSMQSKLHNAPCDSMYEKIASSETKKVARVAVDLSALSEALKGYLIVGNE
jgi:hypothetical protein